MAGRGRWLRSPQRCGLCLVLTIMLPWLLATATESQYLVTNWRTEDGLPHSSINAIIQSRDGYLWIGTFVGIVRFDGARFTRYSSANLPQLGPGRVSRLFEDSTGTLWIGLETGRLLAWKDSVVRIHLQNSDPPNQAIVAMAEDKAGSRYRVRRAG